MEIKKGRLKKPRLKKAVKKSRKVLFKIKPLVWPKQAKIKKPSKPAKLLVKIVKKIKPIKTAKLKKLKPKLAKPIEPPTYKARIKVIGIGGGGSSIVSEIAPEIKKANFIVANTDFQALQRVAKDYNPPTTSSHRLRRWAPKRFQFGKSITQGLGTGMNPELGEQAAESDKEKIKELLKDYNPPTTSSRSSLRSERAPTDFCILVSCLGGGTGSGAAPVFAKILKNLKILTLGIFTLPFEFEGGKRIQIAKDSLEKLRQNLNALVIIPNQKIFQIIDKNTPLKEAFSAINKAMAESLEGLITLIYSPGLIHVDFAALKTNLAGRGRLAYLNAVEAKSPNQIEELAKGLLSNPLLPYSAQGAKDILFNIDGGLNLNMGQIEQIGKTISSSINPKARVAFGITQNKKEEIKITLLVNGCKWGEWEQEKEKPKKKPKEKQTLITKIQDYNPPSALPFSRAPKLNKKTEKKPPELPKIQQPKITQIQTEEPEDYNPPTTSSHPPEGGRAPVEIKVRKMPYPVVEKSHYGA